MNNNTLIQMYREVLSLFASSVSKRITKIDDELASLPKGKLVVCHKNNRYFFSRRIDGRNIGITKDQDLIHKLAKKRYLEYLKQEMRQDMNFAKTSKRYLDATSVKKNSVSGACRKYSNSSSFIKLCADAGLDVMRITCTAKQYKWYKKSYVSLNSHPEELKYSTKCGVKVRSKSEMMIGNLLELNGIPYHYEEHFPVYVADMEGVNFHSADGIKAFYPDFTIMLPDGSIIIWEHLGRVDKEDYRKHNAEKIFAYRQYGNLSENQLIMTFENDISDEESIARIIRDRILLQWS